MSLKIATIYHAQISLIRGGIPVYLNQTNSLCNIHNCQFDNYGYYKHNRKQSVINKTILDTPMIVYGESQKQELIDKLNEYDLVINYLPVGSIKKEEHKESFKDFVFNVWKEIKATKVIQQHTAFYGPNLITNEYTEQLVEYADIIMTRSKEHPFAKYGISKGKPWAPIKIYYDFNKFDHIDKTKKKKIVALGRYKVRCKQLKHLDKNRHKLENEMEVQTFPKPYEYEDGIKALAESMVCFAPTKADLPYEYGNLLEYVQIEALANDCVLVLDKYQGETCYHNDVKWIDIPNFVIWFDKNDSEQTWEQIKEVVNNDELRNKFTIAKEKFIKDLDPNNFMKDLENLKNTKIS